MPEAALGWLLVGSGLAGVLCECRRPGLVLPGTLGLAGMLAGTFLLMRVTPVGAILVVCLLLGGAGYIGWRGWRNKRV